MEMTHQLIPFLKRLRLSGILETLEARNLQAIEGKWTYVEFLARLLEDEVERRAQKQLALRIRRAATNTTKTLGGSIILTSNRAPEEWPDLFGDPLLASAG
jgi:DNA replication protein DnaC